jgi:tRNA (cmo5U34)-methyltransferase
VVQYHDFPGEYLDLMRSAVPLYDRLQDEVAAATRGVRAQRILDLGIGTGETARRCLALHHGATIVGVDSGERMLEIAAGVLEDAELHRARLEEPLPAGPFELVVSALALHHVEDKRALFCRVADVVARGGRFVFGDVVLAQPQMTPLDPALDRPASLDDQLAWLADAGFDAAVTWAEQDLAVISSAR